MYVCVSVCVYVYPYINIYGVLTESVLTDGTLMDGVLMDGAFTDGICLQDYTPSTTKAKGQLSLVSW